MTLKPIVVLPTNSFKKEIFRHSKLASSRHVMSRNQSQMRFLNYIQFMRTFKFFIPIAKSNVRPVAM